MQGDQQNPFNKKAIHLRFVGASLNGDCFIGECLDGALFIGALFIGALLNGALFIGALVVVMVRVSVMATSNALLRWLHR
jgi:hypothetical protein